MNWKCPHCGSALSPAQTGNHLTCPNCHRSYRPRPQTDSQSTTPTANQAVTLRWSFRAWLALILAVAAAFALPGRMACDLAAVVLALVARHEICGELNWALRAKHPYKRGIWPANVAVVLAGLDLVMMAYYTA